MALGFDCEVIQRISLDAFFDFGLVEYDVKQQAQSIEAKLQSYLNTVSGFKLTDEDIRIMALKRLKDLSLLVAMSKNPSFSSEMEWRAAAVTTLPASREKFRVSGSALIPFVGMSFGDYKGNIGGLLKEIIIGPGRLKSDNMEAVRRFLRSKSIDCEVVFSNSTLRFIN